MSMKVLELKGYKSLSAFNAFNALLLGLKMLPAYMSISYEEFFMSFQDKTDSQKESMMREAVAFVNLEENEVAALVTFCTDKNGVPYMPANLKSLPLKDIHEIIVAVCLEIGRMKVDIISAEEKKKYLTSV